MTLRSVCGARQRFKLPFFSFASLRWWQQTLGGPWQLGGKMSSSIGSGSAKSPHSASNTVMWPKYGSVPEEDPERREHLLKTTKEKKLPKTQSSESTKASPTQLTLNLITGALGAGVLSLPWSTAGASVLTSVLITGVVLLVNAWTIMILVEAAERHQVFDLGGLLARLPNNLGQPVMLTTNLLVWASMFMVLVAYMVVVADSTAPVVKGTSFEGRSRWIVISSLAVLPLCFMDQRRLAFTSTLSILVNTYIFGLVVWAFFQHGPSKESCVLGFTEGNITMVSALMQALIIQMCVLPMYRDLEDRSPEKFRSLLMKSFIFLFFLFSTFASLAFLAFGPMVQSNVLRDLPMNFSGNAARIGMLIVVLGVYPIMLMPMTAPLQTSEGLQTPVSSIATAAIVAGAMICGFFVRDLGYVNVVNGAACVGGFVALGPGLVGLYLLDRNGFGWRTSMVALIILGLVMSFAGLMYTDNYAGELLAHCYIRG